MAGNVTHAGRPTRGAVHPSDLSGRAEDSRPAARHSLADAPEDAGWSLGTDLAYLRELVAYWADGFDWLAQEAALARLPHFRVRLGGLGIHFCTPGPPPQWGPS